MNRRRLFIFFAPVVLVLVVAIGLIARQHSQSQKNPQKTVVIHDKTTGQSVSSYPNQSPETGGLQSFVLFNGGELANFVSPAQYPVIVGQIGILIKNKTHQSPALPRVVVGSVAWDLKSDRLNATIQQDNPSLLLKIKIQLLGPGEAQVSSS